MNLINKIKSANKKTLISIFGTMFVLLAVPVTVFVALNARQLQTPAAVAKVPEANVYDGEAEFLSNEILVKFKKPAVSKIKGGSTTNTGITSLNSVNVQIGATKFEKSFKGSNINLSSAPELASWYKVTLNKPKEILKGDIGSLSSSKPPTSKGSSKKVLDRTAPKKIDSKTLELAKAMRKLRDDPNVEKVEPVFLVRTQVLSGASLKFEYDRPNSYWRMWGSSCGTYDGRVYSGTTTSGGTTAAVGFLSFCANQNVSWDVRPLTKDYNIMRAWNLGSGTFKSASNGSATFNWSWEYTMQVFPSSFASCSAAGTDCKTVHKTADAATKFSNTFTNLYYGTAYKKNICAPDCVFGAWSVQQTATTPAEPTSTISAANTNIAYNTSTTITWSSTNATACTVTGTTSTATSGSFLTGNLTASKTYTATCSGSTQSSVTVAVGSPPPTVDIKANGSNGPVTITYNHLLTTGNKPTISWTSTNSDSCLVDPDSWTGTSGSQVPYSFNYETTYSVTCTGSSGTATDSVSVNLKGPNCVSLSSLPGSSTNPDDSCFRSRGTWGQTYDDLWGIKRVKAPAAWNTTVGSGSIVVAVVDTGVDRGHSDLVANMWTNSGEKGSTTLQGPAPNCSSRGLVLDKSCNNLDDDGKGYIDDYNGWNFVAGNNDPMDDHGHGTHVAGTIGAVGNNEIGVVGVNQQTKIMAVKFLDETGYGSTDQGAEAIRYAADNGAKIINNSWGGPKQPIVDDAVAYAASKNVLVVSAAGNSNSNAYWSSPAGAPDSMAIAAYGVGDSRASFSNYGPKIDVAAPGVDVLSTRSSQDKICSASWLVGTKYCRLSGTSMASPHVAGLAALILAKNPAFTAAEVRQIIRASAEDLGTPGFDGNSGRGMIDANKALTVTSVLFPKITSPSGPTNLDGLTTLEIKGSVLGSGLSNYKVFWGAGSNPTSWNLLNQGSTPVTNGVLANWNVTNTEVGDFTIKLEATNSQGLVFDAIANVYKESYISQITNTPTYHEYEPDIWQDRVVYLDDMYWGDIHVYDIKTRIDRKITNRIDTFKARPRIYGDSVIWMESKPASPGSNIYYFNLTTNTERQITTSGGVDWGGSSNLRGQSCLF